MAKNLILLAFIVLTACGGAEVRKEEAELHSRIGTSYLMKGHYPQALAELLEAERLNPDSAIIQNNLGLAYFVRKEFDLAEEHIAKALKLNPKYSDARNNLGRVYIELARYDDAIVALTLVTKDLTYTSPEKAYVNLGLAEMKKGDLNRAMTSFRKSIETNNKFCAGYNYYGQALFQQQKYHEAVDAFDTALKLCNNKYDEAHYYSALSYFKAGEKEKAEARLEEVVRLYPQSDYAGKARSMLKMIR